jgi:hypothetical protein
MTWKRSTRRERVGRLLAQGPASQLNPDHICISLEHSAGITFFPNRATALYYTFESLVSMARSSSKTRQNRPSNSNTTSEDIEMNSHDNTSTSAPEKTNGDNPSSAKRKSKDTESSVRDASAASSSSSKRVSTARPLSKQVGASAAGNATSSDKAENMNSDGADSRKRLETKRYEDVEGLRADLKTASEEAKHVSTLTTQWITSHSCGSGRQKPLDIGRRTTI